MWNALDGVYIETDTHTYAETQRGNVINLVREYGIYLFNQLNSIIYPYSAHIYGT